MSNAIGASAELSDPRMSGCGEHIELDSSRHWHREKYIPIAAAKLTQIVLDSPDMPPPQREQFQHVFQLVDSVLHGEYHARQKVIKESYAPFDPDSDQSFITALAPEEREQAAGHLVAKVVELLERANYERRSIDEIKEAVNASSAWGVNLSVDFDVFERLDVFSRGDIMSRRTLPRRMWLFPPKEVDVEIYQRLVVIFRLRPEKTNDPNVDTSAIHIKLFKNIPKDDLEMLLPGTRVRMSLLDQGKIWLPTLSGIGLVIWKLFAGAIMVAVAGLQGILAFVMLVSGIIGYGLKSFHGYLNTRTKYQLNVTRNLYYQNLGNNCGVLYRMLDEAEEQDYREMLLAYYPLWKEAGAGGWSMEQLDQAVERQLQAWIGFDIDFEVDDALEKLERHGLVIALPDNRFRAVSLNVAQQQLELKLALPQGSANQVVPKPHLYDGRWDDALEAGGRQKTG